MGRPIQRNVKRNFAQESMDIFRCLFREALDKTKGVKRILEVGCNTGHNLIVFNKLNTFELFGIDPQLVALKIGKENGVPAVLIKGSSYNIPFFDGYFDFVMTAGVLMHIHRQDLPCALKEIDRVTNKYLLTIDYFDDEEVLVEDYHGYENMLWRRDMRKVCSEVRPNMRPIWRKRLGQDKRTGKYTWAFLFEK